MAQIEDYIRLEFVRGEGSFEGADEYIADLLSSDLAELAFDSFEMLEGKLVAYCPRSSYERKDVEEIIKSSELYAGIEFSESREEAKDWNEEWEKNYFVPIVVAGKCVICSSFHKDVPEAEYKIVINPRMSFGTGHHQTTELMLTHLSELDMKGKKVMDMGCGTAILSIYAAMLGAKAVDAVDIDEWAYENSIDNLRVNNVEGVVSVRQGDATAVSGLTEVYDVFLANINKNILMRDIPVYAPSIRKGGVLVVSGFYKGDAEDIEKVAAEHRMSVASRKEKDNWMTICMVRE